MANIIVDTREQRPYTFNNSVRKALSAGDYSIEGLEQVFAIERKSLDDWVNTLLRGSKRFTSEIEKLKNMEFACIVIEAGIEDILAGNYKSQLDGQALLGMTIGLMQSAHPVHVVLAGNRPAAYTFVKELLLLAEKRWGGQNASNS